MSSVKTAWHPPFTSLLTEKRPHWAMVTGEVSLTSEPLRVDDLIELRAETKPDLRDLGGTLHEMWRHIVVVGLLEFKSISRTFRHGDLYRLLAYGWVWLFLHQTEPLRSDKTTQSRLLPQGVTLILAVPSITPTLRHELETLNVALDASPTGYTLLTVADLRVLVIDLGVVAEREDDDLLRWFAGRSLARALETNRWVGQHMGRGQPMNATPELEGWEDWVARYVASLPPEQRLAGLAPEQRLAGLSEADQVLALPTHLLKALSDEYIATLPESVQALVRARRG